MKLMFFQEVDGFWVSLINNEEEEMLLLKISLPYFYYVFLIIVLLLIAYLTVSYQKLKLKLHQDIDHIFNSLDKEKRISKILKNYTNSERNIRSNIQQKLTKIKIDIFNVDFTLSEIFSKI